MKKSEFNTIFIVSLIICVIIAVWAVGFNASFTVAAWRAAVHGVAESQT